jgi:hypothetical protein
MKISDQYADPYGTVARWNEENDGWRIKEYTDVPPPFKPNLLDRYTFLPPLRCCHCQERIERRPNTDPRPDVRRNYPAVAFNLNGKEHWCVGKRKARMR